MLVALALVACALSGCGTSTSDQIKAKVAQFGQAVAAKDGRTLCDQVLAPVLLEHLAAIGLPCEKAMTVFFGTVRDPSLAVGRVVVTGRTAQAITLSGARGQTGSLSAVDLVNTSNGWRVYNVGSPLIPGLVPKKK